MIEIVSSRTLWKISLGLVFNDILTNSTDIFILSACVRRALVSKGCKICPYANLTKL